MDLLNLEKEKNDLLLQEKVLEVRLDEVKQGIEYISNLIIAADEYKKFRSKGRSPIYDFPGKKWNPREFVTNALKVLNGKGNRDQIKAVLVNGFGLSRTRAENIVKKHLSTMINEKRIRYDDSGTHTIYILNLII